MRGIDMVFRCGIVGIGSWYSQAFARAVQATSRHAKLIAAAHLGQSSESVKRYTGYTREGFADEFAVNLYESAREMIHHENLDVVFVCAHDAEKRKYAELAVREGCHVYVAKPLCLSTVDAQALREIGRETGRTISTLEPGRYDGAIREARTRVVNGEIGEVISARCWIQHGQPGKMDLSESVEMSPRSGGTLFTLGVYAAGLLNWLLRARPSQAWAVGGNFATPWYPHPDQVKATVVYADGRLGSCDIYFGTPCRAPAWEIEAVGTQGIIRVNQDVFEGTLYASDSRIVPFYRNQNDVILEAIRSFLESLSAGAPPDLDMPEAIEIIRLCEGWKQSIETGAPVQLN